MWYNSAVRLVQLPLFPTARHLATLSSCYVVQCVAIMAELSSSILVFLPFTARMKHHKRDNALPHVEADFWFVLGIS